MGDDAAAIRLAHPADVAGVAECVRAAYVGYIVRIGRAPMPMGADYAELIALGAVHVLASAAGHIRGVLVLVQEPDTSWIENVAVHPDYQKRGFGRALLAFAEEQARASGLSEIKLYTHELMVENIALYQRLGYQEYERREEVGFRRVFMRKSLS